MKKAMIAMSGGVDSSVAAYLMKRAGYDCVGVTMKLFSDKNTEVERNYSCCSLSDVEDARGAAYKIGIPYYVFNFTDSFNSEIIDKFVFSYLNGCTPNPCIDCNRYMKFDKLLKRAEIFGYDYIVTGHYVRTEKTSEGFILKKAVDETKDQSYVLYNLTQDILRRSIFPLGNMKKNEVRKIAFEAGLKNADKHDSQDICFVPDGDYAKIIEKRTGTRIPEGNFVDTEGNYLGKHRGIIHYTIGQRKGIGLSFSCPMYVCKIIPETNTVVLGKRENLFSYDLSAEDFNWISGKAPVSSFRAKAKIRYRQPEKSATIIPIGNDCVKVVFDEPQRAVTKGQAVVIYDGDIILGGGTIV